MLQVGGRVGALGEVFDVAVESQGKRIPRTSQRLGKDQVLRTPYPAQILVFHHAFFVQLLPFTRQRHEQFDVKVVGSIEQTAKFLNRHPAEKGFFLPRSDLLEPCIELVRARPGSLTGRHPTRHPIGGVVCRQALHGFDHHEIPVIALAVTDHDGPLLSGRVVHRHTVAVSIDDIEQVARSRADERDLVEVRVVLDRGQREEREESEL